MSRKHYTQEQIIGKLREAEVGLAQGQTASQICRTLGIANQSYSADFLPLSINLQVFLYPTYLKT